MSSMRLEDEFEEVADYIRITEIVVPRYVTRLYYEGRVVVIGNRNNITIPLNMNSEYIRLIPLTRGEFKIKGRLRWKRKRIIGYLTAEVWR